MSKLPGLSSDEILAQGHTVGLAQLALAAALLATDCVVPRAEIESALERAAVWRGV